MLFYRALISSVRPFAVRLVKKPFFYCCISLLCMGRPTPGQRGELTRVIVVAAPLGIVCDGR